MRRVLIALIVIIAATAAAAALLDRFVLPGLSVARNAPPAVEVSVASWLLQASVPATDKVRSNPLGGDPADVAAGQALFQQTCEACHAYDGSGHTEVGGGQYPRPPPFHPVNLGATTDGEIFYHIRNGIRNTGMPAWSMPDVQIWQLVAYLRRMPEAAALSPNPAARLV